MKPDAVMDKIAPIVVPPDRMNRFAIGILDATRESATLAPIKPGLAVRLVLAGLAINGIAGSRQFQQFWICRSTLPDSDDMRP